MEIIFKFIAKHSTIIATITYSLVFLLLLLYKKDNKAIYREFQASNTKIDTVDKHIEDKLALTTKGLEDKLSSIEQVIDAKLVHLTSLSEKIEEEVKGESKARFECRKESGDMNREIFGQIVRLQDDFKALSKEFSDLNYLVGELKGKIED